MDISLLTKARVQDKKQLSADFCQLCVGEVRMRNNMKVCLLDNFFYKLVKKKLVEKLYKKCNLCASLHNELNKHCMAKKT